MNACIVLREEHWIRAAVELSEDVQEFRQIQGTWVAENGEPVELEFEWQRRKTAPPLEEDCICSHELASKLVDLLFAGEGAGRHQPQPEAEWPIRMLSACSATTVS